METPSEFTMYTPVDIPEDTEPMCHYEETWEKGVAKRIANALKEWKRKDEETMANGDTETVQKHNRPFMVSLVGIPGSGKTVSCLLLTHALEEVGLNSMIMPHDGYHYPLDYLQTFPDSEGMLYRRGAPDTFDPRALLRDLKRIRDGDEQIITVPAFDHATADPEPDKHVFDRHAHPVVICEGLYLLHDDHGWKEVSEMFDLSIFIKPDIDLCMERLKIRNQCIPGYTPEEIATRVEEVDRKNATTVIDSKVRADLIV